MQDPALADTLLGRTLADVAPVEDPVFATLASDGLMSIGEFARADALLTPLIDDERFRDVPRLWRRAAGAARGQGALATAAIRLDRAHDLEYSRLPEIVDLAAFRTQSATLLTAFRDAAENARNTDAHLPDDFTARVLRAADRWRQIDPDDTAACQAAAGVLNALGRDDLAWAYLTTPLGQRPNEAEPWTALATHLQTTGDRDRAADAYATAFEIEPTNAQILWDHAQLLESTGHAEQARALYQQLADGKWQPRFEAVQMQARERLSE
jgi:tetratricopeptide (TPR) repeat protein